MEAGNGKNSRGCLEGHEGIKQLRCMPPTGAVDPPPAQRPCQRAEVDLVHEAPGWGVSQNTP